MASHVDDISFASLAWLPLAWWQPLVHDRASRKAHRNGLYSWTRHSLIARLGKRDVAARNDGAGGVRARIGCVLPQEGQRALQRVRRVKGGGYPDLAPLLHLIAAAPPCISKGMHALRGKRYKYWQQ